MVRTGTTTKLKIVRSILSTWITMLRRNSSFTAPSFWSQRKTPHCLQGGLPLTLTLEADWELKIRCFGVRRFLHEFGDFVLRRNSD